MRTALHEHHPSVDLPHLSLGRWPTPVRPLAVGDLPAGTLWVKEEGQTGNLYGGNKVRKLEWVLAEALASGASDVVTVGAAGSHHVLATALYAEQQGLRAHAILVPQPDTPHVRENLARIATHCTSVTPVRGRLQVPGAVRRKRRELRASHGKEPRWITVGGSDALGTVGWVAAGLEIADEVACGTLPEPQTIYAPLGSGGTVAGLLVGLRLAGLCSRVVGVCVIDLPIQRLAGPLVRRLARQTRALLAAHGVPARGLALDGLQVEHGWLAGGYGHIDDRIRAALAEGTDLGVPLEETYSAKTFGACLHHLRSADSPDPTLFVATVNDRPPSTPPDLDGIPEVLLPLLANT